MKLDDLLNDFAIRSFRDTADADYISARMSCRAELVMPFLWSAQQAIEKYLKCILLLNRIDGKKVKHDLRLGLYKIKESRKIDLNLSKSSAEFIEHLDRFGPSRYLEMSNIAFGRNLVHLDRAVWELRRFCTLSTVQRKLVLQDGKVPPRISIEGGLLEKIIKDRENAAHASLLWQNAFFGRRRKAIALRPWFKAHNAPLFLHPEILDEVLKYVFLPPSVIEAYRKHKKP